MNEQLINDIKRAIEALQTQVKGLDASSEAAKNAESQILNLSTGLSKLTSEAGLVGEALTRAEAQLNKFFDAAKKGENIQVRTPFGRMRSGLLGGTEFNEFIKGAKDLDAVMAQSPESMRTKGIEDTIQKLTQEREALKSGSKEYTNRSLFINTLNDTLKKLNGEVATSEKELNTLKRQVDAVLHSLQSGAPGTFKLDGGTLNTKPFIEASEKARVATQDLKKVATETAQTTIGPTPEELNKSVTLSTTAIDANASKVVASLSEADKKIQAELERERSRVKARQNLMNTLPGGELAANNLYAQAQKVDPRFTPDKIKSIYTEPSTGISKVNYQLETAEGIFKRTTFTVDKFGNTLVDTQKRFRGFGDALLRDVGEFTKWSIAATVVLAPMKALGDLTDSMIKNQSALADVTISLGDAQRSTSEIFQAGADIARKTGEDLNGVLEAYNMAYRATGGMEDPTKRFAAANKLLTDAITLSKLSTLDQAQAIDVLSASLKQTGMGLNEGETLLNKWIAVTKVANVDLTTLATGFATLGDAAISSGLELEDIGTMIALMSESSPQSAQEVANTVRALVSGIQTDQAKNQLQSLGISLEDTSGKAKTLVEIVTEVNDLRAKGIIGTESFNKLTQALGGGVKRQSSVSSFFNSFQNEEKVKQIYDAQTKASATSGEAQDSLKLKLDIVASAATNLGTAFNELAQSVGTSGGVLDTFSTFLHIVTGLTDGMTTLSSLLGKSGPMLLSVLAGAAYLNSKGGAGKERIKASLAMAGRSGVSSVLGTFYGEDLVTEGMYTANGQRIPGPLQSRTNNSANSASRFFYGNSQKMAAAAIGILPAATTLMSEGLNQASLTKAGTSLGGAAIGALLSGGNPVGVAIGAAVGESFINLATNPENAAKLSALFLPGTTNTPETPKPGDLSSADKVEKKLNDLALGSSETATSTLIKAMRGAGIELLKGVMEFANGANLPVDYNLENVGSRVVTGQVIAQRDILKAMGRDTSEYDALLEQLKVLKQEDNAKLAKDEQAKKIVSEFEKYLDIANKKELDSLLEQLKAGKITPSTYRTNVEKLGDAQTRTAQYYQSFGSQSGMDTQDFFNTSTKIIGESNVEEVARLDKYKEMIDAIDVEIGGLSIGTDEYNKKLAEKVQLIQLATSTMQEMNTTILSQAALLKDVDFSGNTLEEFKIIESEGEKIYDSLLEAQVRVGKITEQQAKAIKDSLEENIIKVDTGYDTTSKVPSEYLQMGLKSAEDTGKINKKEMSFGSQDLTKAEYDTALAGYEALKEQLKGLGYKPEEGEAQIEILKDGFTIEKRDQKIVQYLLGQIEKNTKELNGAYNLPEGASFFVPYQAAKMSVDSTSGGGGGSTKDIVTSAITEATKQIASTYTAKDYSRTMNRYGFNEDGTPTRETNPYASTTDFRKADQKASLDSNYFYSGTKGFREADSKSMGSGIGQFFQQFIQGLQLTPNTGVGMGMGTTAPAFDFNSLLQGLQNISTRLNLTIDNTTTVQLDGRVIASVVKQYLKNDLVRYSNSSSTQTLSVI
jgi:TP901 family phage tail tape measure protein